MTNKRCRTCWKGVRGARGTCGSPVVVLLLHGLLGSSSSWLPVVKMLEGAQFSPGTRELIVITPDLLGFADSWTGHRLKSSEFSLSHHMEALERGLSKLEGLVEWSQSKMLVVGHSFGCVVTVELVARLLNERSIWTAAPNVLVTSICLLSPPFFDNPEQARGLIGGSGAWALHHPGLAALQCGFMCHTRCIWTHCVPICQTRYPKEVTRDYFRHSYPALKGTVELGVVGHNWDEALSVLRDAFLPGSTLSIIHGARDQVIPASRARALAKALPGVGLVIAPSAGHDFPIVIPELVFDWLVKEIGGFV